VFVGLPPINQNKKLKKVTQKIKTMKEAAIEG
jgi:hypothetical protein